LLLIDGFNSWSGVSVSKDMLSEEEPEALSHHEYSAGESGAQHLKRKQP
jgi:hypothetical protein